MTSISSSTQLLLELSALKGVGPAALKKVAALPNVLELSFEDVCNAVPQIARAVDGQPAAWDEARRWADEQLATAKKHGARILSPVDAEYPKLLAQTKDDPFLLFAKGELASKPLQSVAIIGTREPTQHGLLIARRIANFFVEQHWSVVSGLALGCDSVAHQAALDARGHTVAVLAHGLQMVAPSRHNGLAKSILDAGGALVSEYPFGRNVVAAQFVKRDRTQAGMAQGVVMVQSDIRGGSLHASRAALDYGRWLAVPYPTDKDRDNAEPKVQANLVIADGTDAQRAELLRCPVSALRLIKVVRGSTDYLKLIGSESSRESSERAQPKDLLAEEQFPHLRIAENAPEGPVVGDLTESLSREPLTHDAEMGRPDLAEAESAPAYYLVDVGPEDFSNLKIARVPRENTEAASENGAYTSDVDIIVTLSRLDHLQAKLDELKKSRSATRLVDEQQILRFRFQIEDVLTHMKRAADQLMKLDHGAHRQQLRSIVVRSGAATGQTALPLMSATNGRLSEPPLVEVLDHLVDALPRSVSVHGHKILDDESHGEPGVEVHLGDLLFSFNDLVKAALVPQGSYALKTTLSSPL